MYKHSTAYHPPVQGLVERFNRTLKKSLREHIAGLHDHFNRGRFFIEAFFQPIFFSFFHFESFLITFDWLKKASIESRPRLKWSCKLANKNSSEWFNNLPWVLFTLLNSPKQNLKQLSP